MVVWIAPYLENFVSKALYVSTTGPAMWQIGAHPDVLANAKNLDSEKIGGCHARKLHHAIALTYNPWLPVPVELSWVIKHGERPPGISTHVHPVPLFSGGRVHICNPEAPVHGRAFYL